MFVLGARRWVTSAVLLTAQAQHHYASMSQWLVFRNDGLTTAAAYAAAAAEAGARRQALGSGELLDRLNPARPLARRRLFVLRLLRQVSLLMMLREQARVWAAVK